MTRYYKIAISLPSRAAEHVRDAVRKGHAPSASAYIAQAIEERAKTETLGDLLAEMLAETGGPLTAAERRAAERALGIAPRQRSPRRAKTKRSSRQ